MFNAGREGDPEDRIRQLSVPATLGGPYTKVTRKWLWILMPLNPREWKIACVVPEADALSEQAAVDFVTRKRGGMRPSPFPKLK